jgi:hypothetical protein
MIENPSAFEQLKRKPHRVHMQVGGVWRPLCVTAMCLCAFMSSIR